MRDETTHANARRAEHAVLLLFARTWRNLKLLWRIATMAADYLRTGGAIRRSYREKERRGKIYYVDEAG